MRIKDLSVEQIRELVSNKKLQVRSLINPTKLGMVVTVDQRDDNYAWIHWDGDDKPYGGFYDNDCECEAIILE